MRPNVLIVEDDVHLNRLLQKAFSAAQFSTLSAANLGDTLALLQAQPVDFLVLDLGLPDADGWRVVESVAELALDYPTPQIIVITGRDVDALPDGYPVIQKPIRMNDLIRRTFQLQHQRRVGRRNGDTPSDG